MAILEGLIYGIILVVAYIGLTILTGVMIALLNTLFYKIIGNNSHSVCVSTALIGTPIHELGHALFCLIFAHKITNIKLYIRDSTDGTLGYVSHTYKKKNIYQRIGNFFIGVGPIILGSAVILLLLFILSNSSFSALNGVMNFFVTQIPENFHLFPKFILGGVSIFIEHFFTIENIKSVLWWLFVILAAMIAIHMRLSKPDINGAKDGLILSIIVLFLIPVIVSLFGFNALSKMMGILLGAAIYMLCIYCLAVLLSIISVVLAIPLRFIFKLGGK